MPRSKQIQEVSVNQLRFKGWMWIVLLSIVVSSSTWSFINSTHWPGDIKQFIFHGQTTLGDVHEMLGTNFVKGIGYMLLMFLFYLLMFAGFYLLIFLVVSFLLFLVVSHRRKPAVFISYKYSTVDDKSNTYQIAIALEEILKQHKYTVALQHYKHNVQHDRLNQSIKTSLKKCDAVIVVPDAMYPSYVNAEIFAAYYANKPLFIIKHTEDQRLPDTANSGHPVFLLDKLIKHKYKPLMEVLEYVHQYWPTQLFLFAIPLDSFLMPAVEFDDADTMAKTIIIGGIITIGLVLFNAPVSWVILALQFFTAALGAFSTYKAILLYRQQLHLREVARQSIIDVIKTRDQFKYPDFTKDVLECMGEVGDKTTIK